MCRSVVKQKQSDKTTPSLLLKCFNFQKGFFFRGRQNLSNLPVTSLAQLRGFSIRKLFCHTESLRYIVSVSLYLLDDRWSDLAALWLDRNAWDARRLEERRRAFIVEYLIYAAYWITTCAVVISVLSSRVTKLISQHHLFRRVDEQNII